MEITSCCRILGSVFLASTLGLLTAADARAQQTPAPPEAQPQLHPHVHVDVTSTKTPTLLEERVFVDESEGEYFFVPSRSRTERWEQVCLAPCSVDLDRYAAYRIGSLGDVPSSHRFTLPQGTDATTLQVQAGDRLWHRLGGGLIGVGIAALIVGVSLVAAEHLFSDEEGVRNGGLITGGAGLVLLGGGIALSLATATHVYSQGQKIGLGPTGFVF